MRRVYRRGLVCGKGIPEITGRYRSGVGGSVAGSAVEIPSEALRAGAHGASASGLGLVGGIGGGNGGLVGVEASLASIGDGSIKLSEDVFDLIKGFR